MKKILNYLITYKNSGCEVEAEFYITKKDMLTRYLNLLDGDNNISELSVYVKYVNFGDENITGKINKFIA